MAGASPPQLVNSPPRLATMREGAAMAPHLMPCPLLRSSRRRHAEPSPRTARCRRKMLAPTLPRAPLVGHPGPKPGVNIMPSLMIAFLLAFTLLAGFPFAGSGVSLAQTPSQARTEDIKKQDPVPPATDPKLSEQAGTTEPGAKVQATNPNQVFVNGVLAVPGASTDVDTAPAKHSARTDQDDQIPIAGYRLKKLDTQQLQQIAQELGS